MLAHLVPCSGGKPIALAKPNLYLGRRESADVSAPLTHQTARCRLRLVNGWWEIERIDPTMDLRVNNRPCATCRVRPGDELAIGRSRYRLQYKSPDEESEFAMSVLTDPAAGSTLELKKQKTSSGEIDVLDPLQEKTEPMPAPQPGRPSREVLLTPRKAAPAPQAADTKPSIPSFGGRGGPLAHLVPIGGGQDFSIFKPEVSIGRDSSCDVSLRVKTVSGLHCRLQLVDGYWRVSDLGSRNGVRVDGVKCQEAWVFPESRLSIADQRFQLDYKPVGERPAANLGDPAQRRSLMESIGVKDRELDQILTKIGDQHGPDENENKRRNLTIDM